MRIVAVRSATRVTQRLPHQRTQIRDGLSYGLDVGGRGAAAAADERRAELNKAAGVAGEVRRIGGIAELPVDEGGRASVGLSDESGDERRRRWGNG